MACVIELLPRIETTGLRWRKTLKSWGRPGRAATTPICAQRATRNTPPGDMPAAGLTGLCHIPIAAKQEAARAANGVEALPLPKHLLPTTVVGSYPQPDWLVDRAMLSKSVPRTRMTEMWRIPDAYLEQAQDDATVVAIRDMERAGIDIVTDGEIRRESYSNRFATALEGIDAANAAMITLPGPFTMSQQAKNEFYKDDEELAMAMAAAVNAEALALQKAGAIA